MLGNGDTKTKKELVPTLKELTFILSEANSIFQTFLSKLQFNSYWTANNIAFKVDCYLYVAVDATVHAC